MRFAGGTGAAIGGATAAVAVSALGLPFLGPVVGLGGSLLGGAIEGLFGGDNAEPYVDIAVALDQRRMAGDPTAFADVIGTYASIQVNTADTRPNKLAAITRVRDHYIAYIAGVVAQQTGRTDLAAIQAEVTKLAAYMLQAAIVAAQGHKGMADEHEARTAAALKAQNDYAARAQANVAAGRADTAPVSIAGTVDLTSLGLGNVPMWQVAAAGVLAVLLLRD